ncbi:MAG: diadenylate cyclase CdaA [Bacillota bacterium]|jgi:diadenylate cyclase
MPAWLDVQLLLRVIDILAICLIAYVVFTVIRGTRAVQLLKGLLVLAALTGIAFWLKLPVLKWVLEKVWTMAVVAVPVVFQPELRRMLERLGRGGSLARLAVGQEAVRAAIHELVPALEELARMRTGALVAIERQTGLKEYVDTGVLLDAVVSRPLLLTIFEPRTPLHDGAVIIRGNRILAAGCYLPLSTGREIAGDLGTRHRAAVGLSEQSDAIVLVVSEETGTISVAEDGVLRRGFDGEALTHYLEIRLLAPPGFVLWVRGRESETGKKSTGV